MTPAVAPDPIEVRLPDTPPPTKFERERRAFARLLPDLLATHRGQYVAVHDERVVDSGPDRGEVVRRTLDRVRADIFVGLVTDQPPAVVRIPGPNGPRLALEIA